MAETNLYLVTVVSSRFSCSRPLISHKLHLIGMIFLFSSSNKVSMSGNNSSKICHLFLLEGL